MNIQQLFFELIRVSIGASGCLSKTPTNEEWKALYEMAKKQSLVGVCFAGVQKLQAQSQELPEMLYLTWMGMAAKIQQRNETVNRQSVELQARLSADGLKSSILKGQGVASLYSEHLRGLRQSGDIDIYVDCGREKAIEYARTLQDQVDWDYKHLHLNVFPDTEVEMHYVPEVFLNLYRNLKLQKWFKTHRDQMFVQYGQFTTPSLEVDLVYILAHMFQHFLYKGVGMRQFMDYYFVLRNPLVTDSMRQNANNSIESLGMKRFATGVMWIMQEVFGLNKCFLICECDRREGQYILNDIILGGNFGKHRDNGREKRKGKMWTVLKVLKHNVLLLARYPSAPFWVPIYFIWHKLWKLTNKNK